MKIQNVILQAPAAAEKSGLSPIVFFENLLIGNRCQIDAYGMKKMIGLLLTCFACYQVQAASFDCKKAQTNTEHMICDSSSLFGFIEERDEELNIAYQWAMMRVNDKQKLI